MGHCRSALILLLLALAPAAPSCRSSEGSEKDRTLRDLRQAVGATLPRVASLIGASNAAPVNVTLMSRKELSRFFKSSLDAEYPDHELTRRSRAFGEIGLLPAGLDMTDGLVALLQEQAGGLYDHRRNVMIGISDLPPESRRAIGDPMILSHELTHALQDQAMDLGRHSEMALKNIDYEYAVRALIEGMASAVMVAHAQGRPLSTLPDLKTFWRSQMSRGKGSALEGSPAYLKEYLFSPYAEGGAFIQSWLAAHPGRPVADLLSKVPASSEQVLHIEKYIQNDAPAEIDLTRVRGTASPGWTLVYANTLGEFDIWTLFRAHAPTKDRAGAMAAGWDGCRFQAYEQQDGRLALFGASAWDSDMDAREFRDGFEIVLRAVRPSGDFATEQQGPRVGFVIGLDRSTARSAIMRSLMGLR